MGRLAAAVMDSQPNVLGVNRRVCCVYPSPPYPHTPSILLHTTVESLGSNRRCHDFHENSHFYSTIFSCANIIPQSLISLLTRLAKQCIVNTGVMVAEMGLCKPLPSPARVVIYHIYNSTKQLQSGLYF